MDEQVNVPVAQRLDLEQIVGEDVDAESYSRMPIANFGLDMLKSMGWQEGKGIGKNPQNVLSKPIEYIGNYDRAGLGARKELPPALKKRRQLNKELQVDENGKIKHYIEIGKEKEKPKKVERNSRVQITGGKYEGLKGIVTDLNEGKKECYIELEINDELVKVDLAKVKLVEEGRGYVDFEKGETSEGDRRSLRDSERASDAERSVDGSTKGERKKKDEKKKKKKKDKREKKRLKWITPHIWVKVISKKVRDGRLYEKKIYVTDLHDEYSFSALDEKGNLVEELREKDVQTVMPKQNGLLKVLVGENKGKVGVLLERDKKRNKVQVQMVDTMEVEEYTQDDCCMYEEKM